MLEPKVNNFEHSEKPEIEVHETDILIIGGGMAACGCAFECDRWATLLNVIAGPLRRD